ncbi:MAG: hypothetical protein ACP5UJ_08575 [Athalassotoga sp.]|uniref:hypothetical protein n=1 Tax=Athalassotoga sp. TaxID=2022597 RepID=UPI003D0807D4
MKKWIKSNRTKPINEMWKGVRIKLLGHYRYYGVTDNSQMMEKYKRITEKEFFKWLNRRSQSKSYTWEKFRKYLNEKPLPIPKIYVKIWEKA